MMSENLKFLRWKSKKTSGETLLETLLIGKIKFAGLDTFENEPNPSIKTLMNSKLSLTPHIGAATSEAQERIGLELADQIISIIHN